MATIMIVDDNPSASLFAAASLKHLGHELRVEEPTCLFKVFSALHEAPPDLLITDLMMPDCPGSTILRLCQEDPHLKQVKVILLTSGGDREVGRYLQRAGNIHFLAKPVTPSVLAECVEAFLDGTLELNHGWELACKGVVAVVDDSRMTRTYHAACLRKFGYRPVEVEPGELVATRNLVESINPDLILLDYLMPSFNGEAFLRAIRATEALRDTPVLMVTAQQDAALEQRLERFLGVGVAFKPVSVEDLRGRVEGILDGPAEAP